MVEKYLAAVEDQLVGGSPPVLSSLQVGQVIVARRGRGWYRGKVVATDSSSSRVVVNLVDQGATVALALVNIRTGVHSQLSQVPPLSVSSFSPPLYLFFPLSSMPPLPSLHFCRHFSLSSFCFLSLSLLVYHSLPLPSFDFFNLPGR